MDLPRLWPWIFFGDYRYICEYVFEGLNVLICSTWSANSEDKAVNVFHNYFYLVVSHNFFRPICGVYGSDHICYIVRCFFLWCFSGGLCPATASGQATRTYSCIVAQEVAIWAGSWGLQGNEIYYEKWMFINCTWKAGNAFSGTQVTWLVLTASLTAKSCFVGGLLFQDIRFRIWDVQMHT